MSNDVDLRALAVDRGAARSHAVAARRSLLTRYILPLALFIGFAALIAWASRDLLFPPQPVTVVTVFSTSAESVREGAPLFKAAGWIEPRPTPIRVAALAPGVVEKLLVVEDQLVVTGQPIAELVKDDARLTHELAIADRKFRQAELEEARASFVAAKSRFEHPVHLEAAIGEAAAALAKTETVLNNLPFQIRRAAADYEAMQKGYEGKAGATGVIAQVEIDLAKSKMDSAMAYLEELRDRAASHEIERQALLQRRDALHRQRELLVDETRAKDEAEARVNAAMARVEQADVAVAEAKLRMDRMTIVAPVDGRVFRLIAHPGARIGNGVARHAGHDSSTIVTMYQPSMLQVRVDVRFEDLPRVQLKQKVAIANPAISETLEGEVLFISSEADIQKNTLQVKVLIPNPPKVFKPEMLVDVTFLAPQTPAETTTSEKQMKILIPAQLIHEDDGQSIVWVADQSRGVVQRQVVQLGAAGPDGLIEVARGLNISSRILTSGVEGLRDGQRIKIVGEASPTAQFGTPNSSVGDNQ